LRVNGSGVNADTRLWTRLPTLGGLSAGSRISP
jgi:hypothetical protein